MADQWSDGSSYERFIGRWSRTIGREFVRWLAIRPDAAWLDCGCGTGALSQTILGESSPRLVIGCDRSAGFIASAREQTIDRRADFQQAGFDELPSIAGRFDAVVAGLVLNFLPNPADAVANMAHRARTGGRIAAYVWDYAEGMQLLRTFWDAARALDDAAKPLDEGVRFSLCQPDKLAKIFEDAGLGSIQLHAITVPTIFRDFADYWTPFLSGQGPAPGYLATRDRQQQAQLREAVRQQLPVAADGSIALTARAWTIQGTII